MQRRYSKQRELILNYVQQTKSHPSAEMIYQQLKPCHPTLSRGTVYRNLNLLAEDGLVTRMRFPIERFDGRTEPHSHFQCQRCGDIVDLDHPYWAELDTEVSKMTGGVVTRHEMIFYGICSNCMNKEKR
jgi:Fur family peroxide stress response transcriptional regulator